MGGRDMTDSIVMTKYQGLGNDYLILDSTKNKLQLRGKKIALLPQRVWPGCGRRAVRAVEINGKMGVRIFNADGSEAAISGNGVRIFAKYLIDQQYVKESRFHIETPCGHHRGGVSEQPRHRISVNMGKASFLSREIPVTGEVREVVNEPFSFHEKNTGHLPYGGKSPLHYFFG